MKKITLIMLFCMLFSTVSANELTKVGIVDTNKVYTRWIKESADARNFDVYKQSIEDEISKRKIEIDQIDKALIIARDDDNDELVAELESELQVKKINLQEYARHKNKELNARIASDATKNDFSEKFQAAIDKVGKQKGFSIIFHASDKTMLWFHPEVDITNLVIQELME